jgi:hypothetical protein
LGCTDIRGRFFTTNMLLSSLKRHSQCIVIIFVF